MSVFDDAPFDIVTKPEAARRQLATAIKLCLASGDAISVQTLASAAHEVLRVLVAAKGGRSGILDNPLYSEEMRRAVWKGFKRPYSFFKHADRDAEARLRFQPLFVEAILMDAVFMYKHVTGDYCPEALVYILYFFTVYGGELGDHPLAMAIRKGRPRLRIRRAPRKTFFRSCGADRLTLWTRAGRRESES